MNNIDKLTNTSQPTEQSTAKSKIGVVGIIGAGQMGLGISQVCAVSKFDVRLVDIQETVLDGALTKIGRSLEKLVSRGELSDVQSSSALAKVRASTSLELLGDCDLVIEAATENEKVKSAIYEELAPFLKPDAILSTNTSSISITRLGSYTDRPERFMGIHFMNPAPRMELIELIRGIATDPDVFSTIHDFTITIGKTPVISEDFPGFIVNRILLPMVNESVYALYEGVGTVDAIDAAMRLGARHPMGPLELADFIGLDTCLSIMQELHEGLADTKYRPCPLLVKYVEAGWLGRKSGRGFYDYNGEKPVATR